VEVEFLGKTAKFPQGPFILSGLLECPVYLIFCLRDANGCYRIYLEKFSDSLKVKRKGREAALNGIVTSYAARLEHYCGLAPLQWTNFYDFWNEDHEAVR
jgi:predicted LPLAT superfamily acyltransferase